MNKSNDYLVIDVIKRLNICYIDTHKYKFRKTCHNIRRIVILFKTK